MNATNGKIIVIESIGNTNENQTQAILLAESLKQKYTKVKYYRFPKQDKDSLIVAKGYNTNVLGKKLSNVKHEIVNTYHAGILYTLYRTEWKKYLDDGYILILDRYVSSQDIYQSSRLETEEDIDYFTNWLYTLAYKTIGLPKPFKTICLSAPLALDLNSSIERVEKEKISRKNTQDSDNNYLTKVYTAFNHLLKYPDWKIIHCIEEGNLRDSESIQKEIYEYITIQLEVDRLYTKWLEESKHSDYTQATHSDTSN